VSLLLRLERRLEALALGLFARARDRVHPLEIGRRLLREMDQGAVAGLRGTLAPNEYQVFLHPRDFAPYAALTATLAREFEDTLRDRAHELGAEFPGPVRVTLAARDEITPGEIYVQARLAAADGRMRDDAASAPCHTGAGDDREVAEPTTAGDTRVYRRVPGALRLRVQAGPPGAAGREFPLDRPATTIGRRTDQDIVLHDPSVSRVHARLELGPDGPSIVDLDSTNGTTVNGHPVQTSPVALRAGDRIQIGSVVLELLAGP
jgi:hypothetical protein